FDEYANVPDTTITFDGGRVEWDNNTISVPSEIGYGHVVSLALQDAFDQVNWTAETGGVFVCTRDDNSLSPNIYRGRVLNAYGPLGDRGVCGASLGLQAGVSRLQFGFRCCSTYCRMISNGAPLHDAAK